MFNIREFGSLDSSIETIVLDSFLVSPGDVYAFNVEKYHSLRNNDEKNKAMCFIFYLKDSNSNNINYLTQKLL